MSTEKWKIIREERVESNGEVVSRKVVKEPDTGSTRFQRAKEISELLVKLAGLVTVAIAVFSYLDKMKDANDEQMRKNKADSINTARYQAEQLRQFRADSLSTLEYRDAQIKNFTEQSRLDNLLKLQQQEAIDKQTQFQTSLEESHRQFDSTIANSIATISLQNENQIAKEKRDYYVAALTNISINMEIILVKPIESDAYAKAKDALLFELYPKLEVIGDDSLMEIFEEFKNLLSENEVFQESKAIANSFVTAITTIQNNSPLLYNGFYIPDKAHKKYATQFKNPAVSAPSPAFMDSINDFYVPKLANLGITATSIRDHLSTKSQYYPVLLLDDSLINSLYQLSGESFEPGKMLAERGGIVKAIDGLHYRDLTRSTESKADRFAQERLYRYWLENARYFFSQPVDIFYAEKTVKEYFDRKMRSMIAEYKAKNTPLN